MLRMGRVPTWITAAAPVGHRAIEERVCNALTITLSVVSLKIMVKITPGSTAWTSQQER